MYCTLQKALYSQPADYHIGTALLECLPHAASRARPSRDLPKEEDDEDDEQDNTNLRGAWRCAQVLSMTRSRQELKRLEGQKERTSKGSAVTPHIFTRGHKRVKRKRAVEAVPPAGPPLNFTGRSACVGYDDAMAKLHSVYCESISLVIKRAGMDAAFAGPSPPVDQLSPLLLSFPLIGALVQYDPASHQPVSHGGWIGVVIGETRHRLKLVSSALDELMILNKGPHKSKDTSDVVIIMLKDPKYFSNLRVPLLLSQLVGTAAERLAHSAKQ